MHRCGDRSPTEAGGILIAHVTLARPCLDAITWSIGYDRSRRGRSLAARSCRRARPPRSKRPRRCPHTRPRRQQVGGAGSERREAVPRVSDVRHLQSPVCNGPVACTTFHGGVRTISMPIDHGAVTLRLALTAHARVKPRWRLDTALLLKMIWSLRYRQPSLPELPSSALQASAWSASGKTLEPLWHARSNDCESARSARSSWSSLYAAWMSS